MLAERLPSTPLGLLGRPGPPAAMGAGGAGRRAHRCLFSPLASIKRELSPRRVAVVAGALNAVAVLAPRVGLRAGDLVEAFWKAVRADWRWAALAVVLEGASFLGYVVLLRTVLGRATARIGLRESLELTLAGAAATRFLPTAGLGGIALNLWVLGRAGLSRAAAATQLLAFLVLLHAPYMGALFLAGLGLASGVLAGGGPRTLELTAAAFGALVVIAFLTLAAIGPWARARLVEQRARQGRTVAAWRRVAGELPLVGEAARRSLSLLRTGDPRLLGALAWWGFDIAVLWTTFQAVGSPPPIAVLVLAYFVGTAANTIPLPGATSGGLIGALVAFGLEPGLVIAAVLAYRAVAMWLPAPLGAVAASSLRRTTRAWADADERLGLGSDPSPPAHHPPPRSRRPKRALGACGRSVPDRSAADQRRRTTGRSPIAAARRGFESRPLLGGTG